MGQLLCNWFYQLQPITGKLHCKLLFSQNIRDDDRRFSASSVFVLVQQIAPKGKKGDNHTDRSIPCDVLSKICQLSFLLCSDGALRRLNHKYSANFGKLPKTCLNRRKLGFRIFSREPSTKVPFGCFLGAGDAKRSFIFGS